MAYTERLVYLTVLLNKIDVARKPFDINKWATQGDNACGTTCCAMGYAALDEGFRAEGLGLVTINLEPGQTYDNRPFLERADALERMKRGEYLVPAIKGKFCLDLGFEAAVEFFGVSTEQSMYMFDPQKYRLRERDHEDNPVTIPEVIRRINEVIEGYEPEYDDSDDD